ncbi:hypothetical protein AwDysgo_18960 [Bacteroidales bacterium]|nr:hypothetical protein AwDysgo_18960 [Bacteroidales bacterium]
MYLICKAHKHNGVKFIGVPRYIDLNTYLDPLGGLEIGDRAAISRNVTILSHDYSYTTALRSIGKELPQDVAVFKSVSIGSNCFIGAGVILLPGTRIGDNCIIGAGAVVKGNIPSNSVLVGNPAKIVGATTTIGLEFHEKYAPKDIHVDKD